MCPEPALHDAFATVFKTHPVDGFRLRLVYYLICLPSQYHYLFYKGLSPHLARHCSFIWLYLQLSETCRLIEGLALPPTSAHRLRHRQYAVRSQGALKHLTNEYPSPSGMTGEGQAVSLNPRVSGSQRGGFTNMYCLIYFEAAKEFRDLFA
jgi:hypothetical protein